MKKQKMRKKQKKMNRRTIQMKMNGKITGKIITLRMKLHQSLLQTSFVQEKDSMETIIAVSNIINVLQMER